MKIDMELSDIERLILETDMADPHEWVCNFVDAKYRVLKQQLLSRIIDRRLGSDEPISNDIDAMIKEEFNSGFLKSAEAWAEETSGII